MYERSPGSTSSSTFDVVGLNFSHSDGGGGGIFLKLKILNTLSPADEFIWAAE